MRGVKGPIPAPDLRHIAIDVPEINFLKQTTTEKRQPGIFVGGMVLREPILLSFSVVNIPSGPLLMPATPHCLQLPPWKPSLQRQPVSSLVVFHEHKMTPLPSKDEAIWGQSALWQPVAPCYSWPGPAGLSCQHLCNSTFINLLFA